MNDNSDKLNTVFAVILISASAYFVVVGGSRQLDSLRPSQSSSEPYPTLGSQAFAARLWQDPFDSFKALTNLTDKGSATGRGSLLNDFHSKIEDIAANTAVLCVMLEGTPYPEDAEVRRRLRYAVEVALLTSGVVPEDRNHIGAESLAVSYPNSGGFLTNNLNVAFEWFSLSAEHRGKNILLLWVKEDDFARAPLATLGAMLTTLGVAETKKVPCYLIGPRSSNTLKAMADDRTKALSESGSSAIFHILSPEATAPDASLFLSSEATNSFGRGWLPDSTHLPKLGGGSFQRWIATDDVVCSNLVEELVNRRIGPTLTSEEKIVLVSEADTFYGRLLPQVFIGALTNRVGASATNNIWQFSYLRGLEGIKPQADSDQQAKKTASAGTTDALVQAAIEKSVERAEGEAQNDYARRLAELLSDKDAELRHNRGRIRAVGLTGSDVYDKLLLLQALRPKLPEALFFTTDLDARLWMPPAQLRSTRNLLVSSAYPLNPEVPGEQFLPFRDVYQTAVYFACRGAILQMDEISNHAAPILTGAVYEIGRHGPVVLNRPALQPAKETSGIDCWWKPWPETMRTIRYAIASLIVTLGPVLLLIILRGGFRRKSTKRQSKRLQGPEADMEPAFEDEEALSRPRSGSFFWITMMVLVLIGVGALARWISLQSGEEPWSFTDGVSIWATEGFRLAAIALSISFVCLAAQRHERHRHHLWRSYFSTGVEAPLDATPAPDWTRFMINQWELPPAREAKERVDASRLFLDYDQIGRRRFRHARAWIMALSYALPAVLFVLLTEGFPDRVNIRGSRSMQFDNWLLGLSVAGFLLVLFYTLDATRLTGRMLRAIARPTAWPPWLLHKWAREKCIRKADLDGWLDVQFAVDKTRETGRLLIYPFVIFLLLLLARHNYFDNWSWPNGLVAIFTFNFLLAAAGWWFVRQAANHVKKRAMAELAAGITQIKNGAEDIIATPGFTVDASGVKLETQCSYRKAAYAKRLGKLREEIEGENRAAFAPWIQDPTYLALFIPTGVTGLLTLVLGYWLNR